MQNEFEEVKKRTNAKPEDLVKLNVSGEKMVLRRDLLCSKKNSYLEATFSGRHEVDKLDGDVFIDRNPTVFKAIINRLKDPYYFPRNIDCSAK